MKINNDHTVVSHSHISSASPCLSLLPYQLRIGLHIMHTYLFDLSTILLLTSQPNKMVLLLLRKPALSHIGPLSVRLPCIMISNFAYLQYILCSFCDFYSILFLLSATGDFWKTQSAIVDFTYSKVRPFQSVTLDKMPIANQIPEWKLFYRSWSVWAISSVLLQYKDVLSVSSNMSILTQIFST